MRCLSLTIYQPAVLRILNISNPIPAGIICDTITNEQLLRELIDKCQVIVHLAAAVGVQLIVESGQYD